VVDDREALPAFFDFPAEHWLHLRTTNPIWVDLLVGPAADPGTKGPGSKTAGLAMVFKLLESDRWRAVNGPHLVALVRAGARFDKGVMVERPDEPAQEVAA
jgi:putative transposase